MRTTHPMRRLAAATTVMFVLAGCTNSPSPKETPLEQKPEAEIAELARQRADAVAATLNVQLEDWRTSTAPCEGRNGEVAEDGRWNLAGFAALSVAPERQVTSLTEIKGFWEQQGYQITEDRMAEDGTSGAVSMRDPDTGITMSLGTGKSKDYIAVILGSRCYTPVDGEDPANT